MRNVSILNKISASRAARLTSMLASPSPVKLLSMGLLKAGGALPRSTSLTVMSDKYPGVLTRDIFFMILRVT